MVWHFSSSAWLHSSTCSLSSACTSSCFTTHTRPSCCRTAVLKSTPPGTEGAAVCRAVLRAAMAWVISPSSSWNWEDCLACPPTPNTPPALSRMRRVAWVAWLAWGRLGWMPGGARSTPRAPGHSMAYSELSELWMKICGQKWTET